MNDPENHSEGSMGMNREKHLVKAIQQGNLTVFENGLFLKEERQIL